MILFWERPRVWRVAIGRRWFFHILIDFHDLWVGLYWKRVFHTARNSGWYEYDIYLCLLPCLPVRLHWKS